jgi:hypothetical protein
VRALRLPQVDRSVMLLEGSLQLSSPIRSVSSVFRGLSQAADLIANGRQVLVLLDDLADAEQWTQSFSALVANRHGVKLETFENCSPESLIERFNAALGSKNLANAREAARGTRSNRLVLVPDARSLCFPAGLLLARLATNFPGAGIRLIVLVERAALDRCEALIDCFGYSLDIIDGNSRLEIGLDLASAQSQASINFTSRPEAPEESGISPPQPATWKRMLGWSSAFASLALISALVIVLMNRDLTSYSKARAADSQRALVPESVKPRGITQGNAQGRRH